MLESGFAQNPLSWLTPSLGTVDALTPMDAAPPNLKDAMCGPHRKRPATEDDDADAGDNNGNGHRQRRKHAAILRPAVGAAGADAEECQPVVRRRAGNADHRLYRADAHPSADRQPCRDARGRSGQEEGQAQTAAAKSADVKTAVAKPTDAKAAAAKPADAKAATAKARGRQGHSNRQAYRQHHPLDADVVRGAGGKRASRPESRRTASATRRKNSQAQPPVSINPAHAPMSAGLRPSRQMSISCSIVATAAKISPCQLGIRGSMDAKVTIAALQADEARREKERRRRRLGLSDRAHRRPRRIRFHLGRRFGRRQSVGPLRRARRHAR